jgi:peptidoglycan hydrolase-like protein with peptidoglycan-binding domain
MAQDPTPWLTTMGTLDGTEWSPGDGRPNPKIQGWLREISNAYPNMSPYCNENINDNYFAWCGATMAYCMTKAGIAPVFTDGDLTRFLYAAAWLGWGDPVTTTPRRGDVLVFKFSPADHHVTLFEKDNGDGTYSCHGGNQSHHVNVENFPKSCVMGIRRPNATGALPQVAAGSLVPGAEGRVVAALQSALASQGFDPGGIDGEFGPLTSAAVSSFQRARNLPITGIADPTTLQKLGVSTDSSPPTVVTAQPAIVTAQPATVTAQPAIVTAQPAIVTAQPATVTAQPATVTAQPTIVTAQPTMQWQDILKVLVDALISKQQGTALASTQTASQSPIDITQVLSAAIAALAGKPIPLLGATGTALASATGTSTTTQTPTVDVSTPAVLSTIDQIFGGQALAGKKTMLAIFAYVILAILQAAGLAGTATGATATPTGEILTTLIAAFGALGGVAKIDRLSQVLGLIAGQTVPSQK